MVIGRSQCKASKYIAHPARAPRSGWFFVKDAVCPFCRPPLGILGTTVRATPRNKPRNFPLSVLSSSFPSPFSRAPADILDPQRTPNTSYTVIPSPPLTFNAVSR
jgi:hypothetical protein